MFFELGFERRRVVCLKGFILFVHLPVPVAQRENVARVIIAGNNQCSLLKLTDKRLGLFDLGREQFLVDGAVIDLPQGDPLAGKDPVEFDDPADQIGVSLLPERLLALAEELIQKRGNGVGQRV